MGDGPYRKYFGGGWGGGGNTKKPLWGVGGGG